jgi:nucleoside-diphosphate-sugar epimerase
MILVTGATGFVGRALVSEAAARGLSVRGASRRAPETDTGRVEYSLGADLSPDGDWRAALSGIDAVVHAAARVHVMHDTASDPLAAFRRVNVEGTVNLARQAAEAGVRRFIFLSSIKVNGERTEHGRRFRADDVPAPLDPYGISKREAEDALRNLVGETSMDLVVIRPVLVYGPGVKANVAAMMRWLHRGIPLPLGAIHNKRSLVAVGNLVDLIIACISHPGAAGQTLLVSDGEDLSTTALLRRMAAALDVPARLIPVPAVALRIAAQLLGRKDLARRLFESLQVDVDPTRARLGWTPPIAVDHALRETAQHYLHGDTDR